MERFRTVLMRWFFMLQIDFALTEIWEKEIDI